MMKRGASFVAELIAKSALSGRSLTLGGTTLAEVDLGPITSVACFPGKLAAVRAALGGFPAPGSHGDGLCWTGPEQAFLIGRPAPDLAGLAATTDQTGGWTALRLSGPLAADALMRLVPLDLRRFGAGQAARAPLGHMQMVLMGQGDGFVLLVFRSMARTAWHEIEAALKMLAARQAMGC
jgi:heterotetrameric sarcosine oxidase gamma subunit